MARAAQAALLGPTGIKAGFMGNRAAPPREKGEIAVICKNPLCMRFVRVPSGVNLGGMSRFKLTCPECDHEHEYRKEDLHAASESNGLAVNPV